MTLRGRRNLGGVLGDGECCLIDLFSVEGCVLCCCILFYCIDGDSVVLVIVVRVFFSITLFVVSACE